MVVGNVLAGDGFDDNHSAFVSDTNNWQVVYYIGAYCFSPLVFSPWRFLEIFSAKSDLSEVFKHFYTFIIVSLLPLPIKAFKHIPRRPAKSFTWPSHFHVSSPVYTMPFNTC